MTWLWIFVGLCPLALFVLIGFAARIDPLSGRLRARQRPRAQHVTGMHATRGIPAEVIACTE
jgi:hypothetical protein